MITIRVHPDADAAAARWAAEAAALAAEVRSQVARIRASNPFVPGDAACGPAAENYNRATEEFDRAATGVVGAIEQDSAAAPVAVENLRLADQQSAKRFNLDVRVH